MSSGYQIGSKQRWIQHPDDGSKSQTVGLVLIQILISPCSPPDPWPRPHPSPFFLVLIPGPIILPILVLLLTPVLIRVLVLILVPVPSILNLGGSDIQKVEILFPPDFRDSSKITRVSLSQGAFILDVGGGVDYRAMFTQSRFQRKAPQCHATSCFIVHRKSNLHLHQALWIHHRRHHHYQHHCHHQRVSLEGRQCVCVCACVCVCVCCC